MRLHNWNPAWYQPGESLWSVANKLAFAAAASVAEVFEELAGVFSRARETWLFPQQEQAAAIRTSLQLPEGLGSRLFAEETGLPDLVERSRWQLAIRYCPKCLEGFVHRVTFQDLCTGTCPVHACRLTELCPYCKSPFDPLCPQAWTCATCGHTLVEPGATWPSMFRSGRGGHVLLSDATAHAVSPPNWGAHVNRRRVVHDAYEEHASLCAALLGRHHGCLVGETEAEMSSSPPVFFDCPLAAGALFLAGQLGFAAQCANGAWAPGRPWAAPALKAMEAVLWTIPEAQHREAARSITRSWFADVVETFSLAAAAGQSSAVWTPRTDTWLDGHKNLKTPVAAAQLRTLATGAGEKCRAHQVKAIPHRDI